ncbi:MAG TPA: asparaginase [Acidimicrobiia bacterium]|jgi:L-asparaginase II|nr:asparaginase [Acidimicrobiia bacterium]
MDAVTIRSGLIESSHPWSAVVVDAGGTTYEAWGDPDVPLYYRSSVKAFQATISIEAGAQLRPEEMAVACSSHSGTAAHLSLVRSILDRAGLTEASLRCPPDMPLGSGPRSQAWRNGYRRARIFHNCSGKHAGFVAACAAQGWPLESYLEPAHPLQRRAIELVSELAGVNGSPPGVDGCGAPTLRGSIRGLARAFARLSVDTRFEYARTAITRYPALTSGNDRPDGRFAMWWAGPSKGGAEGVLAAARHGTAIAVKSHGGSIGVAVQGAIAVANHLGLLSEAASAALAKDLEPPVLGGGRPVGAVKPVRPGAAL